MLMYMLNEKSIDKMDFFRDFTIRILFLKIEIHPPINIIEK